MGVLTTGHVGMCRRGEIGDVTSWETLLCLQLSIRGTRYCFGRTECSVCHIVFYNICSFAERRKVTKVAANKHLCCHGEMRINYKGNFPLLYLMIKVFFIQYHCPLTEGFIRLLLFFLCFYFILLQCF